MLAVIAFPLQDRKKSGNVNSVIHGLGLHSLIWNREGAVVTHSIHYSDISLPAFPSVVSVFSVTSSKELSSSGDRPAYILCLVNL